jgi:hypothetical protein
MTIHFTDPFLFTIAKLAAALCLCLSGMLLLWYGGGHGPKWNSVVLILAVLLSLGGACWLILELTAALVPWLLSIFLALPAPLKAISGVLSAGAYARLLFWIKESIPQGYAFLQIASGLLLAATLSFGWTADPSAWEIAGMAASVWLILSGFENFAKAKPNRKRRRPKNL